MDLQINVTAGAPVLETMARLQWQAGFDNLAGACFGMFVGYVRRRIGDKRIKEWFAEYIDELAKMETGATVDGEPV